MVSSKEAPQQYKQTSRKGKKAWRKNVDVTDFQEGLETAREEVIKGLVDLLHIPRPSVVMTRIGVLLRKSHQKLCSPSTQPVPRQFRNPTTEYTSLSGPIRS